MTHPDSTAAIAASPLSLWERGAGGVRSYPAYLDSGIPWLGSIPAHWQVKRLRFVCRLNPSRSEVAGLSSDAEISFLPMEAIGEDGALDLSEIRIIGQVGDGYTYFRDGDVLVAKITPCFENGKGALCDGLTSGVGFGTTELHVIRPNAQTDAKYIFYVTQSHPFREFGAASMKGAAGQQRVPEDFIKDFQVAFPPLAEQRAIAAYLDRETTRLDALVAAKERLIALLREKRAALISRAVTRGPDPTWYFGVLLDHATATPSWTTLPLKRWVSTRITDGPHETPDFANDGVPFISAEAIQNSQIDFTAARYISPEAHARYCLKTRPQRGDILICKAGATTGKLALVDVDFEFSIWSPLALIRTDPIAILPRYMFYALHAHHVQDQIRQTSVTNTQPNIGMSVIERLLVSAPGLEEQSHIVAYLDRETAKLDALIATIRQHIEKVKEYRAALIAAAVTGKIDVRERGEVNRG